MKPRPTIQKCGEYGRCISCTWWFETVEEITVPEGWCHCMPHTEPTNKNDWCSKWKSK